MLDQAHYYIVRVVLYMTRTSYKLKYFNSDGFNKQNLLFKIDQKCIIILLILIRDTPPVFEDQILQV